MIKDHSIQTPVPTSPRDVLYSLYGVWTGLEYSSGPRKPREFRNSPRFSAAAVLTSGHNKYNIMPHVKRYGGKIRKSCCYNASVCQNWEPITKFPAKEIILHSFDRFGTRCDISAFQEMYMKHAHDNSKLG